MDLGCGDASLAQRLVPDGKTVLSYDLVGDHGAHGIASAASNGWVVEADFLEYVPLPGRRGGIYWSDDDGLEGFNSGPSNSGSEIVDVVVCCLSLMGINWVGGVYEACRILKKG